MNIEKMNVLMIGIGAQILSAHGGGGAQDRHKDYAKKAGNLTMVVSSFRTQKLKPQRLSDELMVYPSNSLNKLLFLWDAWRLCISICRQQKVDLIVTQDPFATGLVGWFVKKQFKIPLLIGNHSAFIGNKFWLRERPVQNRIFHSIATFLLPRADGVRIVNPKQRDIYHKLGVPDEKIWFQPTPVPIGHFMASNHYKAQENLRKQLKINNKRILLWVGDPSQKFKDLPTLLKVIECTRLIYPDVLLILVGDFSKSIFIRERAAKLEQSGNIVFAGAVEHNQLPAYYYLCELYIHTSTYEGLAKVMVEASACAKPIVSTNFDGVDGIVVDGRNGLLSPIGDHKQMAKNLVALLSDQEHAKEMGKVGQEFVKANFQRDDMVDSVVNIWKKALEGVKK